MSDDYQALLVYPQSKDSLIRALMRGIAINSWEQRVEICSYDDSHKNDNDYLQKIINSKIESLLGDWTACKILFVGRRRPIIDFDTIFIPEDHPRGKLENAVKEINLHWRQELERRLNKWHFSNIDGKKIDKWVGNFTNRHMSSFVADALLRSIDFIPTDEFAGHFFRTIHKKFGNKPLSIGLSNREIGKSSSAISYPIRKLIESHGVPYCLRSLNDSLQNAEICVFVEDGLFSATETIGVFESLLGKRDSAKQRLKAEPLADTSLIFSKEIYLYYHTVVDVGVKLLDAYLKYRELDNIIILPSAKKYSVLTQEGIDELNAVDVQNVAIKQETALTNDSIEPYLVKNLKEHMLNRPNIDGNLEKIGELGAELWKSYIEGRLKRDLEAAGKTWQPWSDERIRSCRFGMRNIGLSHIFSHSAPKATLPVFWVETSNDWLPLFPTTGSPEAFEIDG